MSNLKKCTVNRKYLAISPITINLSFPFMRHLHLKYNFHARSFSHAYHVSLWKIAIFSDKIILSVVEPLYVPKSQSIAPFTVTKYAFYFTPLINEISLGIFILLNTLLKISPSGTQTTFFITYSLLTAQTSSPTHCFMLRIVFNFQILDKFASARKMKNTSGYVCPFVRDDESM